MRINTLYCFVVLLIGYIDGLQIRYRYPSGSVAGQPRRTLTGWTSTDEAGRRRLRRLNNLWSQYRIPPPRSRQYPESLLSLGPETMRQRDLDSLGSSNILIGSSSLRSRDSRSSVAPTAARTPDRSSLYSQYGSLADYLPLPVGEKFRSSPIKDYRSNKQPLPSGPLAPEIAKIREEVQSKVESGYYGSKPLYDFL
uniref:Uncharacterized protein LOC111133156 n=1 Tax=Crassostrea virginica TaxID=6565 RepID=A0A8B8EBC7_CRAVI|nr:uncharacterized protein LOC111133156 [Crassostrea virginica]